MEFTIPNGMKVPDKEPKPIKATNQQRRVLADRIVQNASEQIKALRESVPPKPNLNGFLVSALLNDKATFRDIEHIMSAFKRKAKAGYVCSSDETVYGIDVNDIFENIGDFKEELARWTAINNAIQNKIREIIHTKDTLHLKIMAGSPEAVGKLISEIDEIGGQLTLGNINEANQKLLLGDGQPTEDFGQDD